MSRRKDRNYYVFSKSRLDEGNSWLILLGTQFDFGPSVSQPQIEAEPHLGALLQVCLILVTFTLELPLSPRSLSDYHTMTGQPTRPTNLVAGLRNFLSIALSGTPPDPQLSSHSTYEALTQFSQMGTASSALTTPCESFSGECDLLVENPEYAPLPVQNGSHRVSNDNIGGNSLSDHFQDDEPSDSLLDTPNAFDMSSSRDSQTSLLLETFPSPTTNNPRPPPMHRHPVWKYESPDIEHPTGSRLSANTSVLPALEEFDPLSSPLQGPSSLRCRLKPTKPAVRPTILPESPSPLQLSSPFSLLAVTSDEPGWDVPATNLRKYGDDVASNEYPVPTDSLGLGISVETPLLSG